MPNSTTNPPVEISIPPWTVATPTGATVATAASVTAYKYYLSRVFASGSFVTSGVKYLMGSAGGTAKVRAVLCDAGGTILASSPFAAPATTASVENTLAWSTPYAVTGPATLFIGLQTDTTSANNFLLIAQTLITNTGFLGGVSPDVAAATFVLPTSNVITLPATYAVSTAPAVSLY